MSNEWTPEGKAYVKYYGKYKVRAYKTVKHAGGREYPKYRARVPASFERKNGIMKPVTTEKTADTLEELDHKLRYLFRLDGFEPATSRPGLTIAEYAAEYYDNNHIIWAPATQKDYRRTIEKLIVPGIGDIEVARLTGSDCDRFLLGLLGEGCPLTTLHKCKSLLRGIMESACSDRLASRQVVKTRLPKPVSAPRPFLESDEIPVFRALAAETQFADLYEFLMYTGARPSEGIGMTWDRVDEVNLEVLIDRQWQDGGFAPTKTRKTRTVWEIDGDFALVIECARQHQEEQKRAAGDRWNNRHNLMFTNNTGGAIDYNTAEEVFTWIRDQMGIERLTMHSMRHTYATHTYARTGDIDIVRRNLGHDKYETTLIYIGTLLESRRKYRSNMDGYWNSFKRVEEDADDKV